MVPCQGGHAEEHDGEDLGGAERKESRHDGSLHSLETALAPEGFAESPRRPFAGIDRGKDESGDGSHKRTGGCSR